MGGTCSTNGENRNAYRLFVGKAEGKRLLRRCNKSDSAVYFPKVYSQSDIIFKCRKQSRRDFENALPIRSEMPQPILFERGASHDLRY
jgi:hypothetical protein